MCVCVYVVISGGICVNNMFCISLLELLLNLVG